MPSKSVNASKATKASKAAKTKGKSKNKVVKNVKPIKKKTKTKATKRIPAKKSISLDVAVARIRDILRSVGITGMGSINHCIVFIIARYLDDELCDKIGVSDIYSYDKMMADEEEEVGSEILLERFCINYGGELPLLKVIVQDIKFTNITFKMKDNPRELKEIMILLKDLDLHKLNDKFDIIGTIYELHLKTGSTNSMRDLGQYFTHRLVIKYMVELCNPQMDTDAGKIETIVDPTMGTGGFLTMAMKYLNDKYDDIDWTVNKKRIYGFDIDDNVRNMAALNCLLEVGEFFNDTLLKDDTIRNGMRLKNDTLEKVDIILANEPMGLNRIKYADCCQKVKDLKIKGTNVEPLFVQLFAQSLNDGGRCAVVVPDGVLFNEAKLFKGTREHLVENFNLRKVVTLDGNFFVNTNAKTSILFFEKTKKTKEIEFCKLTLSNDCDSVQEEVVVTIGYDKIVQENYSLFPNRYIEQSHNRVIDISYEKLNTLCEINPENIPKNAEYINYIDIGSVNGSTIQNITRLEGKYPSRARRKIKKGDTIISTVRPNLRACAYIDSDIDQGVCSTGFAVIRSNSERMLSRFLFYAMCTDDVVNYLVKNATGAQYPAVNVTTIENTEIPVPSLEVQTTIVESLDLLARNVASMEKNIEEFESIRDVYMDMNIYVSNNYETMCINDLFEMKIGKETTKNMKEEGDYDFYNGSANSPDGKFDTYTYNNENNYILLIKDGGAGPGKYGKSIGLGKVFLVKGKTAFTTSVVALTNKHSDKMNTSYLYHYLTYIKNNMMDLARYTTGLGHLTITRLKKVKIPIPPLEKQKEYVKYCGNLQNMIDKLGDQIESNKQLMKDIMHGYLKQHSDMTLYVKTNDDVKSDYNEIETDEDITTISSDEFSDEDPFEQPKRIIKKKTSSKSSNSLPGTKRKVMKKKKRKAVVRKAK
jgi:type I restriction enzyme, S subunit